MYCVFLVCKLNGRVYNDGAETKVECNGWYVKYCRAGHPQLFSFATTTSDKKKYRKM